MFSKKKLILSDNPLQLARAIELFREIFSKKEFDSIEYCISPPSKKKNFLPFCPQVFFLNLKDTDVIDTLLDKYSLIISIHCKQIFPKKLVEGTRCINVHPGYNPINRGWYPQVFAIINNLELGATIHEIDEKIDHGAIIARKKVPLYNWDSSLTAYNRVLDAEIELLRDNIKSIVDNTYSSFEMESIGNFFSRQDFVDLREINLDEKVSMKTAIDKLRALTHGTFKNAYFLDKETGKRIYLRLDLEEE